MKLTFKTAGTLLAGALVGTMLAAPPASATLVGDDISVVFDFDDAANGFPLQDFFFDGVTNNPGFGIFAKPVVTLIFEEASVGWFNAIRGGGLVVNVEDSTIAVRMSGYTENSTLALPALPAFDIILADLDDTVGPITGVVPQAAGGALSVASVGPHSVTLRHATFEEFLLTGANQNSFEFTETFDVIVAAAPEPATLAVLLGGLGVVGMLSRRRRRAG